MREPTNSYEWPCPGDLLHMDTSEYVRFQRPGHRVTGDRRNQDRQHRDGIDIVHAIVDDHTRLAYAEIHDDQKAATVVGFLERALVFYAGHGITAKRSMTDNGWQYARSRDLRDLLERHRTRSSRHSPAGHAPPGRWNDSTRRWRANGHTGSSTAHTANEPKPCHTRSTTTTRADHTARSEAYPRSAAFTTSAGRTTRRRVGRQRRRRSHDAVHGRTASSGLPGRAAFGGPRSGQGEVGGADRRRPGGQLHPLHLRPEGEKCYCLFEGESREAVEEVRRRAELPYEQIHKAAFLTAEQV